MRVSEQLAQGVCQPSEDRWRQGSRRPRRAAPQRPPVEPRSVPPPGSVAAGPASPGIPWRVAAPPRAVAGFGRVGRARRVPSGVEVAPLGPRCGSPTGARETLVGARRYWRKSYETCVFSVEWRTVTLRCAVGLQGRPGAAEPTRRKVSGVFHRRCAGVDEGPLWRAPRPPRHPSEAQRTWGGRWRGPGVSPVRVVIPWGRRSFGP